MEELHGVYPPEGPLVSIILRTVDRVVDPEAPGDSPWRVKRLPLRSSIEEWDKSLERVAHQLNELEAQKHDLIAELLKVRETERSLREDLTNFSTFEQICNSGMLRNFKIDAESPFAQVILSLLQQTMELQLSHLQKEHTNGASDPQLRTPVPEE